MIRHLKLVADCGEKTCAREPGKFCQWLRVLSLGLRYECAIFGPVVSDTPTGWLQRHPDCVAAEKASEG